MAVAQKSQVLSRRDRQKLARKLGLWLLYDATGQYVGAFIGGQCVFSGPIANLDWRLRVSIKAAS